MTLGAKKKLAFFVCHHKPGPLLRNEIFTPIHVGAALAANTLPQCDRDDIGDNISAKNPSFCELTAMYWMWKNVDADYYGLFQYRRLLNFRKKNSQTFEIDDLSEKSQAQAGLKKQAIEALLGTSDILTSPRWTTHPVGLRKMVMTNYEFYAKEHNIHDLDVVLAIIKKSWPVVYPYMLRYLHSETCTFANLFVMRADYFRSYAEFLFSVLFEAEKSIDISHYDSYQRRVFGFLAERLCGGFIDYLVAEKSARAAELGVVTGIFAKPATQAAPILANIAAQEKKARDFVAPERVHVTFAIDDKYAPHCAAAIASLLANLHESQELTIHILHDETLSQASRERLASLLRRTGLEMDFVAVAARDFDFFPNNRAYISRATYYRLVLHKVLPASVAKTIYIDADVILADNICKTWIDLGDNFAAACADEGGVMQSRRLGLPATHIYFNAGVCLFNLEKLRAIDADSLYLESFVSRKRLVTLQDQDILNIAFCGKTALLPLRWNANARLYRHNNLDYRYSEAEAQEAAHNPGLIHYTDSSKPWQARCAHPLASLYWRWRKETPWALTAAESALFAAAVQGQALKHGLKQSSRGFEQRLRPHLKRLGKSLKRS